MSFKRRLKREINQIKPSQAVFENICRECEIPAAKPVTTSCPNKRKIMFAVLPVFACVMLAVICSTIIFALPSKDGKSYVLLETNAKLELAVEDDVVVEQRALDEQAQVLLFGNDLKGLTVAGAVRKVVDEAEKIGLINKGDAVSVSVLGGTSKNINVSNIASGTNPIAEALKGEYALTSSFTTRSDLERKLAGQLDIDRDKLKGKSERELLSLYAGRNAHDIAELNKNIAKQINAYKAEFDLSLKSDEVLEDAEHALQLMQSIKYNLSLYLNSESESLVEALNKYVALSNEKYGDLLAGFTFDEGGAQLIDGLIAEYENRVDTIVNEYKAEYQSKVVALKMSILSGLSAGV